MDDDATAAVPQETGALIDHILGNCHEMHRADLASLVPLAEPVEQLHADDPEAPMGLASTLTMLAREIEDHMVKEELFPAMRAGSAAGIEHPVAVMRADHDDHSGIAALIRQPTDDLTPAEHASGSWQSPYCGIAALQDELAAHIALENDVLLSRFEPAR